MLTRFRLHELLFGLINIDFHVVHRTYLFEPTPEVKLLDYLGVRIHHGWVFKPVSLLVNPYLIYLFISLGEG